MQKAVTREARSMHNHFCAVVGRTTDPTRGPPNMLGNEKLGSSRLKSNERWLPIGAISARCGLTLGNILFTPMGRGVILSTFVPAGTKPGTGLWAKDGRASVRSSATPSQVH